MMCSSLFVCYNFYPLQADDAQKFVQAAKRGNLIPLYKCIFSDQLTPVLAYRCLVKEDDREAPSFLFESVEQGFQTSNVVRPCHFLFLAGVKILPSLPSYCFVLLGKI